MNNKNDVVFAGIVLDEPRFSHKEKGARYCTTRISYSRPSGKRHDVFTVIMKEEDAKLINVKIGSVIRVKGIYCHRKNTAQNPITEKLYYIKAHDVSEWWIDINTIELSGTVINTPNMRTTPKGVTVCEVLLKTIADGRVYNIPLILWNNLAEQAYLLEKGSKISVSGMLQSRPYSKVVNGEKIMSYAHEVSVVSIDDFHDFKEQ